MSSVKGCKRCSYKTIYHVDYERSALEQKIYYTSDKVCRKCNYNPRYKYHFVCRTYRIYEMPLDKVTDDMNIDLSRIVHKHNHNKLCSSSQAYKYDNERNCIETVLIKRYECDFCGKLSDYIETISICKHIYDKIEYEIDYKKSAQEQKICYNKIKTCSKCNYVDINYSKTAELDNYPSDMNVDLSKIIHEHNHNKFSHIEKDKCDNLETHESVLIKRYECDFCGKLSDYTEIHEHNHNKFNYVEKNPIFDNEGNCIELVLINHYKCDCGKIVDYTDINEKYDLNNPCDEMNLLTIQYKEYLEYKEKGIVTKHPTTTNIGICPKTGKIFKRKYTKIDTPDNYIYGYVCTECHEKI